MINYLFTKDLILVLLIIIFRAYYNWNHGRFTVWAFSAVIIVANILGTIFDGEILEHFVSSKPWEPLLFVTLSFISSFWLYKFLNSQFLHNYFRTKYPEFVSSIIYHSKEIVVFTEIIATLLAYTFLSKIANITSFSIIEYINPTKSTTLSLYTIVAIVVIRFIYNIFLGNYKTFVFWSSFIAFVFISSILTTRDNFAINVITYTLLNFYLYTHVATEENFYNFFASTKMEEAQFAVYLHFATAIVELIASSMIIGIFVKSFGSIQNILPYYFG